MAAERLNWLQRMPKVELHLHLEGAIPHKALWELICKYGGDPTVPSCSDLARRFCFTDFSHFIENWNWKNGFLREYEDFTFSAEAVARDLAGQGIIYAEVFFSPADFSTNGLQAQKLAEAVRTGLARVDQTKVNLVVDLVRDYGPDRAMRTLIEVSELKQLGIIGVGIGGTEHRFPPELFESVFAQARRFGFKTSAHAGETSGPASVWGAIRSLDVDRIGHATRAIEDDALVDYLAETRMPVEVCPVSNVRTGVVSSLEVHPIRRYLQRGILVTVNTDDPAMFGNSLAGEFDLLAGTFGLTNADLQGLLLNAARSAWIPEEAKADLIRAITIQDRGITGIEDPVTSGAISTTDDAERQRWGEATAKKQTTQKPQ